ncbi:MAG: glucosyltransferase domain-containing protein [Clostridiales bacterium]|jgi:hypothetical protein|nr:glucosyltransferase domain-containing protein [Clostridiales bacterium]
MLQRYKTLFLRFLKDKWFMLAVSVTAVLAYSFFVFNFSPNVEDLSFDLYYGSNNLLVSAGRFGTVILDKVLNIYAFRPMIMPFLGIMTLVATAILWCCQFKKISGDSLSRFTYVIFACFFIAAPLLNEVLIYTNQSFSIPLCFFLVTVSIILIDEWQESRANMYWAIAALTLVLAIYESFVAVFISGLMCCFLVRRLYGTAHSKRIVWNRLWLTLEALVLAIAFRYIVGALLKNYMQPILPGYSEYTTSYINWHDRPFLEALHTFFSTVWLNYFIAGAYYLPIAIFDGALIAAFVCGLVLAIRRKSKLIAVLFAVIILTNFAMPVFLGQSMLYRACQVFGFFAAFVLMILAQSVSTMRWRKARIGAAALILLLLFYQINDMNKWFFVNNLRYNEDVRNFTKIGNDLRDNYEAKPVVFVGLYRYTDSVMRYVGVLADSNIGRWLCEKTDYIPESTKKKKYVMQSCKLLEGTFSSWGVVTKGLDFDYAYDPNYFVFEFLRGLGFECMEGGDYLKEAQEAAISMPMFPNRGYILDTGPFLVVNFGM